MSRATLYFFDQEELIDLPGDYGIFKKMIPAFFYLTENSFKNVKILYNNTDSTVLSIENEKDFKSFLQKKIKNLYLDAQGDNELYEKYLEAKDYYNGENKEIKRINELQKKDEELTQLYNTKFKDQENEIENMKKLIKDLESRKTEMEEIVRKGKEQLKKEQEIVRKELNKLKKK